jgi:hypothetical protein
LRHRAGVLHALRARGDAPGCALCVAQQNKTKQGQGEMDFGDASPYPAIPSYYVPQLLGLMAVFKRPHAEMFCYTMREGCKLFRIDAAPEAWAPMLDALHEFWHDSVLPARQAICTGATRAELQAFAPRYNAERSAAFQASCVAIAASATCVAFASPPEEELPLPHQPGAEAR